MPKEPSPKDRLQKFVRLMKIGGCRIISQGDNCECPLCDLDRVIAELSWYAEHAASIKRYLSENKTDAAMACMVELSLDGGKRYNKVTGENV